MMGTLARFLAEKDIPTGEDRYQAHVEGDIEDVNGVLRITRIRVHYDLTVPSGKSEEANQAFERYLPYCPGAQSVIGCIHIEHHLKIEEEKG
jgi:organic hydroperoxide reductase OsmC/OhrA